MQTDKPLQKNRPKSEQKCKSRPKSEQKCKSDRRPMDLPPSLVDRVSDPPAREHARRMSQLYAVTQ